MALPIHEALPHARFVAPLWDASCCTLGDPYSGDKTSAIIANSPHARVIIQTYVQARRSVARTERATKSHQSNSKTLRSECDPRGGKRRGRYTADFQVRPPPPPRLVSRERVRGPSRDTHGVSRDP